jgi:hypothetical protein
MRQIHTCTQQFFGGRGWIGQPVSSTSSVFIVFCIVVHKLKQACPLKSGISLLAQIHRRCVLYQEFILHLVLVITEQSEQWTFK